VLVVPWLLEGTAVVAYLLARCASLCIPAALCVLARRVTPQLVMLAAADVQAPFRAAAARINLGYLMVCGAVALFVLGISGVAVAAFGSVDPVFSQTLIWLVLGQSAPVLFGATGLLMQVVDRGAFHEMLQGLTTCLFLAGLVALGARDGVLVAQTFAAAQLAQAALCAVLLTQCGVWPGLTALFHKEIKLF